MDSKQKQRFVVIRSFVKFEEARRHQDEPPETVGSQCLECKRQDSAGEIWMDSMSLYEFRGTFFAEFS